MGRASSLPRLAAITSARLTAELDVVGLGHAAATYVALLEYARGAPWTDTRSRPGETVTAAVVTLSLSRWSALHPSAVPEQRLWWGPCQDGEPVTALGLVLRAAWARGSLQQRTALDAGDLAALASCSVRLVRQEVGAGAITAKAAREFLSSRNKGTP